MIINKIQPCYNYSKINFKAKSKENTENPFNDDAYKKFSQMQKNYYSFDFSSNKHLNVVFPVNGDDSRYLRIARSNIMKLEPQERIMSFNLPNYTEDEAICSKRGYTDGICECIAVVLYDKEKGYLYHLCPINYFDEESVKQLQQVLQKSISDLNKKDCRAFLYGGIRGASDKLYGDISEVLDKNKIKSQEVLYNKDNHITHSIYFDVEKGIILSQEVYAYHSKQQLEEYFEKVNLQNYFYSEIL